MENIEKINISKLKEEIKKLSTNQKFFKEQRKTVNIKNKRIIEPWEANYKHNINREKLSIMYATLLVLNGFSLKEATNMHLSKKDNYIFETNKNKVYKILNSYKENEN